MPDLPDTVSPSIVPALKTRSPKEVSLGGKEGALFFLNPLFKSKDNGALKRSHFQKSIKVRVSTENSGSLSPPLNPPPPVPCEEAVKEEEEVVPVEASNGTETRQTEEISEEQEYRKPRSSLRQRLRKSLSKGSRDFGMKLSPMRSKDIGDYNVPSTVTKTQHSKDARENHVNGVSVLEEHDSGSISSAEDITSEDGGKSPQLTRRKKKKSGRSSFRAVSGAFLSLLSPERKMMILIEELGKDLSTEFGKELQVFIQNVELNKNKDVKDKTQDETTMYNTLLKDTRVFLDRMKQLLRDSPEIHLEALTADEQGKCLPLPLSLHAY